MVKVEVGVEVKVWVEVEVAVLWGNIFDDNRGNIPYRTKWTTI